MKFSVVMGASINQYSSAINVQMLGEKGQSLMLEYSVRVVWNTRNPSHNTLIQREADRMHSKQEGCWKTGGQRVRLLN